MNASERAAYAPTWYTATMVPADMRGPLTFDLDVDVCVIGAGLAGLTAAREIARRGWSVAVLEADRIAGNASGRNDGFVLPGFAESMERVVSRVGMEHAKALWDLSEMGLRYVRTTIAEARMPGVAPIAGWLKVSKVDNGDEVLAAVQLYGQELGAEVEGWPTERVREVLKTDHYFHALHLPRAFHIHPLNYALGLAEVAEAAGARIFEGTPALAIDAEGVRKRVTTPSARVRAGHIVLAGNVHLAALMPRVVGTLMPIWSYVVTTAPLGPKLAEAIAYRGAVTDTDLANNHYRIVGNDRLLWSGHSTTWDANPARMVSRLRADIAAVYPQLGEVEVEHVWSGVLGNPLHRMPQIGELSPGVWLTSGFGGHGLNTTAMAGNIVAQAIVDGDDSWRLFAPFELVWAGGRLGRAAMQVYYWWFDARERFAARQARQREEEYRRGTELAALRAGEEQAHVEARLGAVVPREALPEEPALAELPADPVAAGEIASPSMDRIEPDEHSGAFDRTTRGVLVPARDEDRASAHAGGGRPSRTGGDAARCTPNAQPVGWVEFFTRPNNPRCCEVLGLAQRSTQPTSTLSTALAPRHEGEAFEQMHVLLVLEQGAVQRRNELLGIALAQDFRADVFDHQQLEPIQKLGGRGLLLHPRHVADLVEQLERLGHQTLLDAGKVHFDDRPHRLRVREADVVKEAAAQECVGQFFFVVGGDHHDRPPPRLDGLAGLVDEELHAIEFLQQVVGKLDIGLVDLVDQQHRPRVRDEGIPELAALDVVANVLDALVAELAVAQTGDRVILVEALQRLGGGFDVPLEQRCGEALGDFEREHGLAGAGLALDQQGALERDGGVDGDLEVVGHDVGAGSFETHGLPLLGAAVLDRNVWHNKLKPQ